MFKFKGKTKSFSEIKGQDTLWYTFKEGQEVKVEKKQVKKTIKKAIKKVAKKVNKK